MEQLPFRFEFVVNDLSDEGTLYYATIGDETLKGFQYAVSWAEEDGTLSGTTYSEDDVREGLERKIWTITRILED